MAVEMADGPVMRVRNRRFQITFWKTTKVIKAKDECGAERVGQVLRVCVQYSRFSYVRRAWENQSIWFNADELRDLIGALEQFNR